MRIGIEVGGTFTDLVAVDGDEIRVIKVPSTRLNPDEGAFTALTASGASIPALHDLVHGSTVATNAVLEGRGAAVAFIATQGFRDMLFIQRHDRRHIYDLRYRKPALPLRRKDCFEVAERINAQGEVLEPLALDAVEQQLIPALRAGQYDAIAICLLSAYASPLHEQALKQSIAKALLKLRIACSHEVAPEFREFERASTTVLSAYVQPVIDRYLNRFEATLHDAGFAGHFSIMQSNGGRLPAEAMRRNAITALFSGPAAGVIGAVRQASHSGRSELITFDMGGTSTDISLVRGGEPDLVAGTEIDGLPVRTPLLDIVTVGAGGGSLVWIDEGGMLRVGPQSAGAVPGPACYGKGGTAPTITDAHVVRGTIRPGGFLGGTMQLDQAASRKAFALIAAHLGTDVEGAAAAAIRLAVANIVRAVQLISTERGRDPRSYTLLPFGGAGPLLAVEVAEELGSPEILVPPNPGVMSAFGLIASDDMKTYGMTRRMRLDSHAAGIVRDEYRRLLATAQAEFQALALEGTLEPSLELEMRFVGQAFEIAVPIEGSTIEALDEAQLRAGFVQQHRSVYLHDGEIGRPIEIVSLRFTARRRLQLQPRAREQSTQLPRPATSPVHAGAAGMQAARVVDAAALAPGARVHGPALIEGYSSTSWLPPGWNAERDAAGNLLLRREAGHATTRHA